MYIPGSMCTTWNRLDTIPATLGTGRLLDVSCILSSSIVKLYHNYSELYGSLLAAVCSLEGYSILVAR